MINADSLSSVREHITQTKTAFIFLRANPSFDHVLSALALANSLRQAGIETTIAASDMSGVDAAVQTLDTAAIQQKIGNKNLTISFPYREDAVDSVSYHINDEQDRFYLVVKPQAGARPLASDEVEFDYSGIEADLIFLVGVHKWDQLEYFYETQPKLFSETTVIAVHSLDTELTPLNLNTGSFGSICEGLSWMLEGIGLQPDATGATYLLQGIEHATDSFRSLATTADTFESVAKLMRLGARRVKRSSDKPQNNNAQDQQKTVVADELSISQLTPLKTAKQKNKSAVEQDQNQNQNQNQSVFSKALQEQVAKKQAKVS